MKNFFEHQDQARRNTRTLLLLMTLGVIAMGLAIYLLFFVVRRFAMPMSTDYLEPLPWFQPELLAMSVVGTGTLVAVASLGRTLSLRSGGGARVAETLGGRLVSGNPRDVLEKRFVNVLEEMSIASGMPVPRAYVLDGEVGINAFAAGMSNSDAVVAVTRGCLEKLTREELQGVVAHEMSHITHGDMRINMRLMGVVFGILCIAFVGRLLLRFGSGHRNARGRSEAGSMRGGVIALGVGLLAIGSLGELCAKMIKAAIGRQREYLADASAVQFTRNPQGIAGALKKIGGFSQGSVVESTRAEEASHMFFGDIHARLNGLLATHPPLVERIRRVNPGFDGVMPEVAPGIAQPHEQPFAGFSPYQMPQASSDTSPADAASTGVTSNEMTSSVGTLKADAVVSAQQFLRNLPAELREGVHNAFTASAIAYAMLWSSEPAVATAQDTLVRQSAGSALADATQRVLPLVRKVSRAHCLALAELLSPALHALSPDQRANFHRVVLSLVEADHRLSLFEHLLSESLLAMVAPRPKRDVPRRLKLSMVQREVELLLSLLAQVGATTAADVEVAFQHAAARLPELRLHLVAPAEGQLRGLSHCLNALRALAPLESARIVDAMAHCALSNQRVTTDEATLVAATCLALSVPMPPWLPSQGDGPR